MFNTYIYLYREGGTKGGRIIYNNKNLFLRK